MGNTDPQVAQQPVTPPVEPTAPPPTPEPPITTEPSSTEVVNWEDRAKGFQRVAQEKHNLAAELQAKVDELTGTVARKEETIAGLELQINQKAEELQSTNGKLGQSQQTVTAKEAENTRLTTLMDYPDLWQFKTLLREDFTDAEKYREYLEQYRGTVANLRQEATTEFVQGATQPSGSGSEASDMTPDQVYENLMAQALDGQASEEDFLNQARLLKGN